MTDAEPFTFGEITVPADVVAGLDPEKVKARREMFRCPECGAVADARVDVPESGTRLNKRWLEIHDARDDEGCIYIHLKPDEVDHAGELARYMAAMDKLDSGEPEPEGDSPDLDPYHRQRARERQREPRTDGGMDWTEQYATTTYRGPQKYPVPGAWVLGIVEGDGIRWKHYPGAGEGASHDSSVMDAMDPDEYSEGPDAFASLTNEHPEDADVMTDPPYHELKVGGDVVMVLKDASEVDESEWWSAIAEALARYDSGEDVETVLTDLGLDHLKADPFGAREDPEDAGRNSDRSLDEFATDGGGATPEDVHPWEQKAEQNIQKWGQQPVDALTLAMIEEMGELAGDVLAGHEHGDTDMMAERGRGLMRSMKRLGEDTRDYLETVSEGDDGEPIPPEDRPEYLSSGEGRPHQKLFKKRAGDELDDLMALGFQFQRALDGDD